MNRPFFKSPPHKLRAFFQASRDLWRARAKDYHQEIRWLEIRVRDLEASRDHWRQRYFETRDGPVACTAHRAHEPPPTGAMARRSSARPRR